MYIVRLDYQNGLHKEYAYRDLGAATAVLEEAARAKDSGHRGIIRDEAGRTAHYEGNKLQSVEMVDAQAEAVSAIQLMAEIQAIQRQFGLVNRQPQEPPNTRDEEPEYRPPMGRIGATFAS
jgi:hypothetical protein